MTGGSLGMAFRASSLRLQSSFCGLLLVCGIKDDRFFLCNAGRFNVHFNRFCWKIFSDFQIYLSLGPISKRDKKSAAVFIFPVMCAVKKLYCSTKSQAFDKGGGFIFVWKNLVADLLSIIVITGLVARYNFMSKFFEGHVNS